MLFFGRWGFFSSGEYCGGREGLKRSQLRAFVESAVQKGIHFGKVSLVPNQMSISWEQVCVAFSLYTDPPAILPLHTLYSHSCNDLDG